MEHLFDFSLFEPGLPVLPPANPQERADLPSVQSQEPLTQPQEAQEEAG